MVSKTNGKDFMDVQATTMKDFSHFCNIRLERAKDKDIYTCMKNYLVLFLYLYRSGKWLDFSPSL